MLVLGASCRSYKEDPGPSVAPENPARSFTYLNWIHVGPEAGVTQACPGLRLVCGRCFR